MTKVIVKIQKLAMMLTLFMLVLQPIAAFAKEEDGKGGLVDDSLRDMSVVLGVGAAGAVLGLSTLSFVDVPSQHMKNIAVGGAIGIVVGVAIVIFSQASKTSITNIKNDLPISPEKFASLSKKDFLETKIRPDQNDTLRILLPF